jgi:hypothetical protein
MVQHPNLESGYTTFCSTLKERLQTQSAMTTVEPATVAAAGNTVAGLTAAVSHLSDPDLAVFFGKEKGWQEKTWAMYDLIGEVKYAVGYYANSCSKAKIVVQQETLQGEILKVEDPQVLEIADNILRQLVLGNGSLKNLLKLVAASLKVSGECWLLADTDETLNTDVLKFLPKNEIRKQASSWEKQIYTERGAVWEQVPPGAVTRIYNPHPKNPRLATSNLQSAISAAETLLSLEASIRAVTGSRTNAGILKIPEELNLIGSVTAGQAGHETGQDESPSFKQQLFDSLSEPIADPAAASAVVPYILFGSAEYLKQVELLQLSRDYDENLPKLLEKCLSRIGTSLDLPSGLIFEPEQNTHWSSWHLSADFVRVSAEPGLTVFTDGLNQGLFHPALRENGVTNFWAYKLAPDVSGMIQQPNLTANALDAYKLGAISTEAFIYHLGFNPDEINPHPTVPGTPRTSEGVQPDRPQTDVVIPQRGETPDTAG